MEQIAGVVFGLAFGAFLVVLSWEPKTKQGVCKKHPNHATCAHRNGRDKRIH